MGISDRSAAKNMSIRILAKHTNETTVGHVYWELVSDFLDSKNIQCEWEESLWVYAGYDEEQTRQMLTKLFQSQEFQDYKAKWFDDMKKLIIEGKNPAYGVPFDDLLLPKER